MHCEIDYTVTIARTPNRPRPVRQALSPPAPLSSAPCPERGSVKPARNPQPPPEPKNTPERRPPRGLDGFSSRGEKWAQLGAGKTAPNIRTYSTTRPSPPPKPLSPGHNDQNRCDRLRKMLIWNHQGSPCYSLLHGAGLSLKDKKTNTQRTLSPWESFRPRHASRLAGLF